MPTRTRDYRSFDPVQRVYAPAGLVSSDELVELLEEFDPGFYRELFSCRTYCPASQVSEPPAPWWMHTRYCPRRYQLRQISQARRSELRQAQAGSTH